MQVSVHGPPRGGKFPNKIALAMEKKTVCIIGSGISGLTACHLLGDEYDVTIIEREKTVNPKRVCGIWPLRYPYAFLKL